MVLVQEEDHPDSAVVLCEVAQVQEGVLRERVELSVSEPNVEDSGALFIEHARVGSEGVFSRQAVHALDHEGLELAGRKCKRFRQLLTGLIGRASLLIAGFKAVRIG